MGLDERFSTVSLTGGPAGWDTELLIDGERAKGVTRVELIADVRDAVRLKTFQIVRAQISLQAEREHAVTVVVVEEAEVRAGAFSSLEEREVVRSTADTLWQALYDCARQLELQAKLNDSPQEG